MEEIIAIVVGTFFEIAGEFFFQLIVQGIVEVIVRPVGYALGGVYQGKPTWYASLGYAIMGFVVGGLSILIHPQSLMPSQKVSIVGLIVVPIILGGLFSIWGLILRKHGKRALELDTFFGSWAFAVSFGAARMLFAR